MSGHLATPAVGLVKGGRTVQEDGFERQAHEVPARLRVHPVRAGSPRVGRLVRPSKSSSPTGFLRRSRAEQESRKLICRL